MGCFSFKCQECGEGVNSTSFEGEMVRLFLLKDGTILQEMEGEYNSYGMVFTKNRKDSIEWKNPDEIPPKPLKGLLAKLMPQDKDWDAWGRVCDLMHDENPKNGIAAIHSKCFKKLPTKQSEHDPDQGWNKIKEKHRGCEA